MNKLVRDGAVALVALSALGCPRKPAVVASFQVDGIRGSTASCLTSATDPDLLVSTDPFVPNSIEVVRKSSAGDYQYSLLWSADEGQHARPSGRIIMMIQFSTMSYRALYSREQTLSPIERFFNCARPERVTTRHCFKDGTTGDSPICRSLERRYNSSTVR